MLPHTKAARMFVGVNRALNLGQDLPGIKSPHRPLKSFSPEWRRAGKEAPLLSSYSKQNARCRDKHDLTNGWGHQEKGIVL